uniref:Uncharacterized protein n=1 Tax=Spongospora subterranea TaxID=70186 RepID=A0A0H5QQ62_9EUKA|eukprot:CRZ03762.1 hypothetical protein [Spongospora subterranea]
MANPWARWRSVLASSKSSSKWKEATRSVSENVSRLKNRKGTKINIYFENLRWKGCWFYSLGEIITLIPDLDVTQRGFDSLQQNYALHSIRRGATSDVAQSGSGVEVHHLSFKGGWKMETLHTVSEYIVGLLWVNAALSILDILTLA